MPLLDDEQLIAAIRRDFLQTYLSTASREWLDSEAGSTEVRREILGKYHDCLLHMIPWVERVKPLAGKVVVEVGCGTGAKAAAFAQRAARVVGCDLSTQHLAAARARVARMGLQNVELHEENAVDFTARVARAHPDGVDVILLYAVLEHLTLDERLETIQRCWSMLKPDGVMVVAETPNRLLPHDFHSSRLPFFNMLPDELALRYLERSPREDYKRAIRAGLARSWSDGMLALARQGRGVSYHEFELVLGALEPLVAADSYAPEVLNLNPLLRGELELNEFFRSESVPAPAAFSRYWIELVLSRAPLSPVLGRPQVPVRTAVSNGEERDGWLVLEGPRGWSEYKVPRDARELVVEVLASDQSGPFTVEDARGRSLRDVSTRRSDPRAVYFGFDVSSAGSRVRIRPACDDRGAHGKVWLRHVHVR